MRIAGIIDVMDSRLSGSYLSTIYMFQLCGPVLNNSPNIDFVALIGAQAQLGMLLHDPGVLPQVWFGGDKRMHFQTGRMV
jgi:hypothetical protein